MYTTLRVTPPVVLHNCCSYTRKEVNRLPLPVSRNFGQPHNVITPLLHAVLNIYEPEPAPCVQSGAGQSTLREKTEEDLREKRGKGDWDKPRGLAAAVLPPTLWELGVQGKYS